MRCIYLVVTMVVVFFATIAQADSLRCQRKLVEIGDSVLKVEDICGKPARRVAIIGEDNNRVGTAYYYRGRNGKADRKVIFGGGEVVRIKRLP